MSAPEAFICPVESMFPRVRLRAWKLFTVSRVMPSMANGKGCPFVSFPRNWVGEDTLMVYSALGSPVIFTVAAKPSMLPRVTLPLLVRVAPEGVGVMVTVPFPDADDISPKDKIICDGLLVMESSSTTRALMLPVAVSCEALAVFAVLIQ